MSELNNKKALHVATFSGWYRFEQDGKEWKKTKRDLTYWTLTCLSVDSEDPKTIYAGTEHSGLFYTKDAGAHWHRANPNPPKMMLFSTLALNGGVMVVGKSWKGCAFTVQALIFRPVRSCNRALVILPMTLLRPTGSTRASKSVAW